MRITKLSLTNFRSFKETQCIEFAPITLLFGPNSAGKSTVLMALAYIQQILDKGHCNPQRLDAMGNKVIGGFQSLVNGQDLNKSIKIKLEFEGMGMTPYISSSYDSEVDVMSNHLNAIIPYSSYIDASIHKGAIELEIAWSFRHQRAYVKNYRVWNDGKYVGCISSKEDLKGTEICELNTRHPKLITDENDEWFEQEFGFSPEDDEFEPEEYCTEFEMIFDRLNPNSTVNPADTENAGEEFINYSSPIALACHSGAIPWLGRSVLTNLNGQDFDQLEEHLEFRVVQQILSDTFVLTLDILLAYLKRSIQIGPLRVVPDHNYVANPHPEQADWVDGSAAWDLLYKDPDSDAETLELLKDTNDCLYSIDKLNTGYELYNQSVLDLLPAGTQLAPSVADSVLQKRHLHFKDINNNAYLTANQLGTGISQTLPIVVAANYDPIKMISVEQPELHIHPRLQVELADVLLQARSEHPFLIETHSEHLILRLLRRIRETTDDELPEAFSSVSSDDISIVYIEPSSSGVQTKRIRIDEDGEFIDKWPQGFFAERSKELF